jgi:hypothetical protein
MRIVHSRCRRALHAWNACSIQRPVFGNALFAFFQQAIKFTRHHRFRLRRRGALASYSFMLLTQ